MYISMDRLDLQFSSKAKLMVITKARLQKISRYLEDKPVLERFCGYQSEAAECMVFGQWLGPRSRDTPINNGGAGGAG